MARCAPVLLVPWTWCVIAWFGISMCIIAWLFTVWCATSIGCNCDALHCNRSAREKSKVTYIHSRLLSCFSTKKETREKKTSTCRISCLHARRCAKPKGRTPNTPPKPKIGGIRKARASRKNKKKRRKIFILEPFPFCASPACSWD